MLKGIKKTANKLEQEELQHSQIKAINSNLMKQSFIQEEEQQIEREIIPNQNSNEKQQQKQTIQKLENCFKLYLSGQKQQLKEELQLLKQIQNKKVSISQRKDIEEKNTQVKKSQNKGKFSYELNFQDEEDQTSKKRGRKDRTKPIMVTNRFSEHCLYCPDNQQLKLISASNYVYLAFPKKKTFKKYFHLVLAPVDHEQTMIGLNEDLLTEITNFKKCLIQAFDQVNMHTVFIEQFSQQNSHIFIDCVAIPHNKAEDLPFFYKQALETVEGNWTTHKSILKIEKEKGGLQKQIPKKIKYFYIDFCLGYGYAHVIENQKFWNRDFPYEILATSLGIQMHEIKTTEQYTDEELKARQDEFMKIYKKYDWTELL